MVKRNETVSEEKRESTENAFDLPTPPPSDEPHRPSSSQPKTMIESPPDIFPESNDDDIW